jgi:large subunit ribosomal protein L10
LNINSKKECVKNVKEKFDKAEAFFITHNLGLKADQITALRKDVKSQGGEFKVVKNTLMKRAVEGKSYGNDISKDFEGPVAVAFSYKDPVAVAKALYKYVDDSKKLLVKTGFLGQTMLSAKDIEQLSKLPGRDELIAKAVRTIAAPLQSFMGVLTAVPRDFLNVLTAVKDKK